MGFPHDEFDGSRSRGRPPVSDLALHMHAVGILASLGTDHPGSVTTTQLNRMSMDTTTAVVELELAGLWHRDGDDYLVDDDELDKLLEIIDEQLRGVAEDCARVGGHLVASDRPGFCVRCMSALE